MRFLWMVLALAATNAWTQEPTSRLWMSSPYLDHQTHKAICGILRDAGYDVRDYTPQEVDRRSPNDKRIAVGVTDDRYSFSYPRPEKVFVSRAKDGFTRRNGVVNGYDYRADALGVDSGRIFADLKKRYDYSMDTKTDRRGDLVSMPDLQGFTAKDIHTFVAAPQNDESAVLNHLYRSVLTASEKQGMGTTTIHFDARIGTVWFHTRK